MSQSMRRFVLNFNRWPSLQQVRLRVFALRQMGGKDFDGHSGSVLLSFPHLPLHLKEGALSHGELIKTTRSPKVWGIPYFNPETDEIVWMCPRCKDEGRISNWKGTIWVMSSGGGEVSH